MTKSYLYWKTLWQKKCQEWVGDDDTISYAANALLKDYAQIPWPTTYGRRFRAFRNSPKTAEAIKETLFIVLEGKPIYRNGDVHKILRVFRMEHFLSEEEYARFHIVEPKNTFKYLVCFLIPIGWPYLLFKLHEHLTAETIPAIQFGKKWCTKTSDYIKQCKTNHTFFEQKHERKMYDFSTDEEEIGRNHSYAVFPELKKIVKAGNKITIQNFRNALSTRGITDLAFQNKILNMILQNRFMLQHSIVGRLSNILYPQLANLHKHVDYKFEVDKNQNVTFIIFLTWGEGQLAGQPFKDPAIDCCCKITITPKKVELSSCEFEKLSDTPIARAAFKLLKDHQQSLFQRMAFAIKHSLGLKTSYTLESHSKEDQSWCAPR